MSEIGIAMLTVAVVGAMPPSIIASLALWQTIQNGRKAKDAVASAENSVLEAAAKTEQIHKDTNGNLARMRAELAAANKRIDDLLERLDKQKA